MTTTHIASAMVPGFERTIGLAHALIDGIAADRDLARYTVRISGRDWGFGDREKSE